MKKILLTVSFILISIFAAYSSNSSSSKIELKFLQLNLWVECTHVVDAPKYLIEQIAYVQPDIATFCELYKSDKENPVLPELIKALKSKGLTYYSARIDGRAVISKYPIIETERVNKWMFKAIIKVQNKRLAIYPAHSEYRWYSCYYPRGYNDGSTNWDKLPAPITNVNTILSVCEKSDRIASIKDFVSDAQKELKKGSLVFLAGDLNEPSYMDWQSNTKDKYDHNGCVVNWGSSKTLITNGYKDAYRVAHPNVVKCPGFTFPADNKAVETKRLAWAFDADERERIDFVYYYPNKDLKVKKAQVFGPESSIVRGQRVKEQTSDSFIRPLNDEWPSDHKGVLITFTLKNK